MRRRKLLLHTLKLLDLFLPAAAFAFSILVISSGPGPGSFRDLLAIRIKLSDFVFFLGYTVSWHIIFSFFDLYDPRRAFSMRRETPAIIKATSAGTTILLLVAFILNIRLVTPVFLVIFWITTTLAAVIIRVAACHILKQFRVRAPYLRNVIIVGTNVRALSFARMIELKPELGYALKGFADDSRVSAEINRGEYPLVSSLGGLPEYLRWNVVDEVVIALPIKSFYARAAGIVAACGEQGVAVRFLSDLFNVQTAHMPPEDVDGQTITIIPAGTQNHLRLVIKRLVDVLASFILLLALASFFLVVAVAIKVTSSGPVFFIQERLGMNKRLFRLYKFRTMVPDAELRIHEIEHLNEAEGPAFKIRNDPRITPIGRLLRKTSIDELPQLFNVLKGDMSLVGPRPMNVRDYERFEKDWHRRRFSIRPGITCLWQCSGRSNVSFEEWMKLDLEYIENWSLSLDFKILLQTIPAVLKGSGAA